MHPDGPKSPPGEGFILVGKVRVYGKFVDGFTRCSHYHSVLDIIAIKFPCCNRYYPCRECHDACAGHEAALWPTERRREKAVLCGACGTEQSIGDYLDNPLQCPACHARFNPRCVNHHHLYFEGDVMDSGPTP